MIIMYELQIYGNAIVDGIAAELGYFHVSGLFIDKTYDQATKPVEEPVLR